MINGVVKKERHISTPFMGFRASEVPVRIAFDMKSEKIFMIYKEPSDRLSYYSHKTDTSQKLQSLFMTDAECC